MKRSEADLVSDLYGMPPLKGGKTGVLLVNIGTPEAPTPQAVRRYLREFLSDPRVIEVPQWIWKIILNGFILPIRAKESAKRYAGIWDNENNQSPLKTLSAAQAENLALHLSHHHPDIDVTWGMRYGHPSIPMRMDELQNKGCERIIVLPLYPQYAASTTASTVDAVSAHLARKRAQPHISFVPPFYNHPAYIEATALGIKRGLSALNFTPERLLLSFHGIPIKSCLDGDPYFHQCRESFQRIAQVLEGHIPCSCHLTFQSRFGRDPWLQPYTDKTVIELAKKGVKKVAIATPGFISDCLETLEEIAEENASFFREHGGEDFAALPCLNASSEAIVLFETIIKPFFPETANQFPPLRHNVSLLEQAC
jgi:ferrochelatase